ncbi:MAG: metal ABC transporter permease [Anaerovoracaceae bacterium]|jgi:ABC-type Mn2+/Zn2+ transport system permease subunit
MMELLSQMFTYSFMVRALIVGSLVSLCASLLGTSLVLKQYSMIGDGLSHVGFCALAVAYAFNAAPLAVSIPVCIAAAFILLQIRESSGIRGDSAVAIMCSGALAIGVMTVSLTTGMNTDVSNYMFGSILAIGKDDVVISVVLSAAVLVLYVLFYNRIFAVTFDEVFATATGTKTHLYNMVLAALTALTIVLGMRMMGALLISSLIVFPSLTAMRVTSRFRSTIIVSAIISVSCFFIGMMVSYIASVPTGACIVITDMVVFAVFIIIGKIRG